MSLKDVEDILKKVRKSLAANPRNEYERQVRRTSNTSLLKEARNAVENYSGDRIRDILLELNRLEEQVANDYEKPQNADADPFAVNFSDNEDEEPEMSSVTTAVEGKKKKKNKKKGTASEKKSSAKVSKEELEEIPPKTTNAPATKETHTATAVNSVEMVRFEAATAKEIPDELLGRAPCCTVPDTAFAVVEFERKIEFEAHSCTCRVEVYRSVLLALVLGEPLTDVGVVSTAAPASTSTPTVTFDDDEEEEPEESGEGNDGEGEDDLKQLSNKLIAEYDAMQMAKEELEDKQSFPKEVSLAVQRKLRQLPLLSWTILMCHGGYFAGGVFVNNKCVVHKSFQRYVVRKKQGGKQSSNAKDGGGSYNSVGSQIRAAQEVKWRIDVCHILTGWKSLIEASNFVFYVAPGPQNLAVLTDFSSLPASAQTSKVGPSPVSVQDPRVRKVPLTTHRPNFEEVQRIYAELSQCRVSYCA